MARVRVSVPATMCSFGPGIGAIGLAVRLYEAVDMEEVDSGFFAEAQGECSFADTSALVEKSRRVIRAFCHKTGRAPSGLRVGVSCEKLPPRGFSLDTGLLVGCATASNVLSGDSLNREDLLALVIESGGAAPAAAAAMLGNLAVASQVGGRALHVTVPVPPQEVVIVTPMTISNTASEPTALAKRDWPDSALTALLVEALRSGDHSLLAGLSEHLLVHRTLGPGYQPAAQAAHDEGASGVFIDEEGFSLIAFARSKHERIAQAMIEAFRNTAHVEANAWIVPTETHGISIDAIDVSPRDAHVGAVTTRPHNLVS